MIFRSLPAVVCIALASTALIAGAHSDAAEIVVGQVGTAATAAPLRAGIQICLDAVNARGGVHGNILKLVYRERDATPEDAVRKTRQLIKDADPIALVGLIGTGPMEALLQNKVLDEAGIPVVLGRAGAVSLHDPVHPLLFHTRANYADEARVITAQLATIGLDRLGVFYENSAFGKEGLSTIENKAKDKKLQIVGSASYEYNTTKVEEAVKALQAVRPTAVIAVAASKATAEFYKAWRATGSHTSIVAMSITDVAEVVRQIGGATARGLIVTQVVPDPSNKTTPVVRELHDNFRRYPQKELGITQVSQSMLEGYLSAKVLVEGLKRAGPRPTRGRLRAAMDSMQDYDAGGVAIGFSSSNHTGSKFVESAIVLRSGKLMR